jgi:hypothetical protein
MLLKSMTALHALLADSVVGRRLYHPCALQAIIALKVQHF